jgi:hypothetical protein
MYDKPITTIIVNGEKLEPFSLDQEWDKDAYSPHFYST